MVPLGSENMLPNGCYEIGPDDFDEIFDPPIREALQELRYGEAAADRRIDAILGAIVRHLAQENQRGLFVPHEIEERVVTYLCLSQVFARSGGDSRSATDVARSRHVRAIALALEQGDRCARFEDWYQREVTRATRRARHRNRRELYLDLAKLARVAHERHRAFLKEVWDARAALTWLRRKTGWCALAPSKEPALRLVAARFGFPLPVAARVRLAASETNVLISSRNEDGLSLAREIDRQGLVNPVLVHPDDCSRDARSGVTYCHRGTIFRGGALLTSSFDPPIAGHYRFYGFLDDEYGSLSGNRPLPTANMAKLPDYTGNKDVTSAVLREASVPSPDSVCFLSERADVDPFVLEQCDRGLIAHAAAPSLEAIEAFHANRRLSRIVVKPTVGHGGYGVDIFDTSRAGLSAAAQRVGEHLERGAHVLVEQGVRSLELGQEHDTAWNVRAFVSRDASGALVNSDLLCRVGDERGAVNLSRGARSATFGDIAARCGLSRQEASALRTSVADTACAAARAIERHIDRTDRPQPRGQQDWLGVDLIVSRESRTPIVIEVNDAHTGGMWDLDQLVPVDEVGSSARDLASCIARRALSYRDTSR